MSKKNMMITVIPSISSSINIINIKKFDTFKEAYKYQKTLTGTNFDDGYKKNNNDHNIDQRKNNNFPLMVSNKGDIYYVYTTAKENLNILHKMDIHLCISSYNMSRAYIVKDKIIVTNKYSIQKKQESRNYCASKGWFVTDISYLQGGI